MESIVRNLRKQKTGVVVSNKMDKTIAVKVERRLMHPLYGKFVKRSKKFFAHDEENTCNVGDLVRIMETRPLSKNKRWRLVEIMELEGHPFFVGVQFHPEFRSRPTRPHPVFREFIHAAVNALPEGAQRSLPLNGESVPVGEPAMAGAIDSN